MTSTNMDRRKGLALTIAGMLVLTPDALLIRLIETDPLTLVFWRCLFIGMTFTCFGCLRHGIRWFAMIPKLTRFHWMVALCYGLDGILFVTAIAYGRVANTLVILAGAPLFAALIARIGLGEKIRAPMLLAMLGAFTGIAVIFLGDFNAGLLWGNVLAVLCALALASQFVAIRAAGQLDMIPALALGAYLGCLLVAPFAHPSHIVIGDFGYLLIMGTLVQPLSFGLLALGPRYLFAAEVNLLLLLETVLGPIWVFWCLGERPPPWAFWGGGIVFFSLLAYFLWDFVASPPNKGNKP